MLEFGILRTVDGPKTLRLNLFNSGTKAVLITVSPLIRFRHVGCLRLGGQIKCAQAFLT